MSHRVRLPGARSGTAGERRSTPAWSSSSRRREGPRGGAGAALRQLRGGIREAISPLRGQIVSLLTLLEASIDFSDDDIPLVSNEQVAERVSELRKKTGRGLD